MKAETGVRRASPKEPDPKHNSDLQNNHGQLWKTFYSCNNYHEEKKSLTSLAKMEMAVNYKRASLLHSKYECDCKKSFVEEADDEERPLTEVFWDGGI